MASNNRTNQSTTPKFTAEMQDRQARNKDPYTGRLPGAPPPDEEGHSPSRKHPRVISTGDDAYESGQRRRWAASILASPELVMLHALARGDSVPGTRHHFTKILCGYDDPPRTAEKRAVAARKEKEKKPQLSIVTKKLFPGSYEI